MKAVVKVNTTTKIREITNEPNIDHSNIVLNLERIAYEVKRDKRVLHELNYNSRPIMNHI